MYHDLFPTLETTTTNFLSSLKDHIPILAAIGGGTVLCVIITIAICCCCRRRRRKKIPRKRLREYFVLIKTNPDVTKFYLLYVPPYFTTQVERAKTSFQLVLSSSAIIKLLVV